MIQKLKQIKTYTFLIYLIETMFVLGMIIYKLLKEKNDTFVDNTSAVFIIFVALFGFNIIYTIFSHRSIEIDARLNHIGITNTLGADLKETFIYGQIGMLIYDASNEIIWSSELFEERNVKCVGNNVIEMFPELGAYFTNLDNQPEEIKVRYHNRTYSVINLKELDLLVFRDVSETEDLYEIKTKQAPVYITIVLDNLADLESVSQQDDKSVQYELEVRKAIIDWAKKYEVYSKNIKNDVYIIVAQEEKYAQMERDKFSIMDDVKTITRSNPVPLTISIGVGRGSADFNKLSDLSSGAIDVALSRGGGQIVINNYGAHMEFLGGMEENRTKKNTVRSRVLSQSLYTHIERNNKILIVPHDIADFDAIGAALGIYSMAKAQNKEAYLVCSLDEMEIKTRTGVKELLKKDELDALIISESKALAINDDKTMVILVDVNRAKITTAPQLIEVSKHIAVINHHRRCEDAVDNPIFSIVETTASSASEIIVGLIKFNKTKIELAPKVATLLFAGLLLDTNGFRVNASADTFEAAMLLKERGADVDVANNFLKEEFEEYELKTKIMNNSETVHLGVLVACAPNDMIVARAMLAKVGQDALNVKGIKAIFVIGKIGENEIGISARSDGSFNVQFLLEKMGGGGHFSMAAAQIQNKTVDEVRVDLDKLISMYINEIQ